MFWAIACGRGFCQSGMNLVQNPSFGDIENCSTGVSLNWYPDFNYATNTINNTPFGTPDLYHSCNSFQGNFGCITTALDGDAFMAFLYSSDFITFGGGEFMAAELVKPLQIHQNYCISFYKNYCDSVDGAGPIILNNFSVGFFNNLYPFDFGVCNGCLTNIIPDHLTDTISYDTIQKGWQKVEYNYIAKENEKYVLLGWLENYLDLNVIFLTTDTIIGNLHYSYMFLDSVVVHQCHNELGMNIENLIIPNIITANNDAVNDNWILHNGDVNIPQVSIEIYNRWGEVVYQSEDYHGEWQAENIQGQECPAGVYYYRVILPPNQQKAGFVTIFR